MKQIEGKIIGILDSYTSVIDKGMQDGLKLKDFIIVFEEYQITWPGDTSATGSQRVPKKVLRVIAVQDKISRLTSLLARVSTSDYFVQNSGFAHTKNLDNLKKNRWNLASKIDDLDHFNQLTGKLKIGDRFFTKKELNPIEILI